MAKVNPHGGGISLGHPIGCTGARIIVTLTNEMVRKNYRYGLATLCIGGGQGMSVILERARIITIHNHFRRGTTHRAPSFLHNIVCQD